MKSIVYKDIDGSVKIINPVYSHFEKQGIPEHDMLEQIKERHVPKDAEGVHIIDTAELPKDRYFRNAMDIVDGKLTHCIHKARRIHLDNLRIIRDKKLKELDIQKMIAEETGDSTKLSEILTKKQELRDLPKTINIDKIHNLEYLKKLSHYLLEE